MLFRYCVWGKLEIEGLSLGNLFVLDHTYQI